MIDKSLADMNYYFSSLSLGMQMQYIRSWFKSKNMSSHLDYLVRVVILFSTNSIYNFFFFKKGHSMMLIIEIL